MSFILEKTPTIHLPSKCKNAAIEELLSNYTYSNAWNIQYDSSEYRITLGNSEEAEIASSEYIVSVTNNGVYVAGKDYSSTMRGFVSMLEKIRFNEKNEEFYIENGVDYGNPMLKFRCVHLCIFPETSLDFLRKCVRSCAIVKYSHIILEFWGMLRYDCMQELSWPFAFSKDEIRAVVGEANALGVEIIPMFNHLGHASACRELGGKHVVLDQNPKYEYLFKSYGWVWDIKKEAVREILSKIREELIDVCGEGKYFHIGCDESYISGSGREEAAETADYINEIAKDLKNKGRRCIMWGDMLFSQEEFPEYEGNSTIAAAELMIKKLDKSILIADWQYAIHSETWKTSKNFKEHGFDVVCCPFQLEDNIHEAINTAKEYELFGIIHTTWDTLCSCYNWMINAGVISYSGKIFKKSDEDRFYCQRVARMALPAHGLYDKCGWSEKMIRTSIL